MRLEPRVSGTLATWAVIAVLAAVAGAARAEPAVKDALWSDEVASARVIIAPSAREGFIRIRRESSPPAWFFLNRFVHRVGVALSSLTGVERFKSVKALRLLSVLFGAAAVALVVVYARRLLGLAAAALAGLLVAVGYQFVLHGAELRAYALLTALAVAFPLVLEPAVARPNVARLGALAGVVALGALTHYFFLLPVFTGLVWLWLLSGAGRTRLRASLAIGAGLLPLLAWLPVTLFQASRVNRYFPSFEPESVVRLYSNLFASGASWRPLGDVGRVALLLAVLAGAAVLARRREGRLCALLATVPLAVTTVVWALGLHIFNARNLLVVGPFAAIALAALVAGVPRRPFAVGAGLVAAVVALAAFSVDRTLARTPHDEIARAVVSFGWKGSDPIVFFAPFPQHVSLAWYLPGHPRLRLGEPGSRPCARAYVVVEGPEGHDWLRAHAPDGASVRALPWYGYRPDGSRRRPDVVVARIPGSQALLSDALAKGALLFSSNRHPQPACLAPKDS